MVEVALFSILAISVLVFLLFWTFYKLGAWQKEAEWQKNMESLRGQIADKQRSGIKGKVAEMFAPYLPQFPFKPSECKFLGDPIDYIVFEGLDGREIQKIHFVDVKTDQSELKMHQKQLKELVSSLDSTKVTFQTVRISTSHPK